MPFLFVHSFICRLVLFFFVFSHFASCIVPKGQRFALSLIVFLYTKRVVGSGIQAQAQNPEVWVKEADPVINQVIDKLKHINQRLQGRFIPKLGTLDQIEMGSGDTDLVFSGQCDDEDGCWGSGDRAAETRSIKPPGCEY
ncbi:glypican-5a isoform X1 [Tachysurus ichikawai]